MNGLIGIITFTAMGHFKLEATLVICTCIGLRSIGRIQGFRESKNSNQVYMTLNMIYYNIYIICIIFLSFNNSLLTNRFRTAFFFILTDLSEIKSFNCASYAPSPTSPTSRKSWTSPSASPFGSHHRVFRFFDPDSFQVHKFNQFLMPKV